MDGIWFFIIHGGNNTHGWNSTTTRYPCSGWQKTYENAGWNLKGVFVKYKKYGTLCKYNSLLSWKYCFCITNLRKCSSPFVTHVDVCFVWVNYFCFMYTNGLYFDLIPFTYMLFNWFFIPRLVNTDTSVVSQLMFSKRNSFYFIYSNEWTGYCFTRCEKVQVFDKLYK